MTVDSSQRRFASGDAEQRVKQLIRRVVGEPYVGKRLKLRSATLAIDRLELSPQRVLDAGSEDATFVYWLADRFPAATVLGVDIDEKAVSACRKNRPAKYGDRVSFEARRFAELPEAAFDLVTAFDVLEHIQDDSGALRDLHRALRPGGTLLVHVPRDRWTDWHGAIHRSADEEAWRINPGHVRVGYSPEHLAALVESAGFRVREVDLWLRRWGVLAHAVYARLERPRPLRVVTIPVTDVCSLLDRSRPREEGNTVWLVATA